MQQIIHNPVDGIYAATPDYVHALEVRRRVSARSAVGASRRQRSLCRHIRRGS